MPSDRREWAAAESVGRAALAISREREVDGFTTLSALLGLGRLHLAKADTAAAVPFLRSAVGMAERFMPADSPELREAKRNLAEAERAVGERE